MRNQNYKYEFRIGIGFFTYKMFKTSVLNPKNWFFSFGKKKYDFLMNSYWIILFGLQLELVLHEKQ